MADRPGVPDSVGAVEILRIGLDGERGPPLIELVEGWTATTS